MSHAADHWLNRCMTLWLVWIAVGALCFIAPGPLGLRGLFGDFSGAGRLWEYPAGTAGEIIGVPVLLYVLSRIQHSESYRPIAMAVGGGLAIVHSLVTTLGFPGVQIVYLGLAATAPRLRTDRNQADASGGLGLP